MCTAVSYRTNDHYFGRNLDLEYSYQETVTITPREFPFLFRQAKAVKQHSAIIGMAYVVDDYPLYYDAVNEDGLAMAGLRFAQSAVYLPPKERYDNIASFEFIPWVLSQCKTVEQAERLLMHTQIVALDFCETLPSSPLHWIIADRERSIVVEPMWDGLKIYENTVGVLTNEPPFPQQMLHLSSFMGLSSEPPQNRFAKELSFVPYSRGMGALGLPGDLSSMSRFVRAAFVRNHSICDTSEEASVEQFFHILGAVEQQNGCVRTEDGKYEKTIYSSCCNTQKGIYYYTTYENRCITAIDMQRENLESNTLISYPLLRKSRIFQQNESVMS